MKISPEQKNADIKSFEQKHARAIYLLLLDRFGPQAWWPAESSFEVVIGAILTQNTNWINVEKALTRLKDLGLLTPENLFSCPIQTLAEYIRPAGYYNLKAQRIHNFLNFLFNRYSGKLSLMKKVPLKKIRSELLEVNGIGPETADSIILYALHKPSFVVDAYTRRFLYRHDFVDINIPYDQLRGQFMSVLKNDTNYFNEYHALIVQLGKTYCRPTPRCSDCPLKSYHYNINNRCSLCFRSLSKVRMQSFPKVCRRCVSLTMNA